MDVKRGATIIKGKGIMRNITIQDVSAAMTKLVYANEWYKAKAYLEKFHPTLADSVAILMLTATSEYNDEGYEVDFVVRAYDKDMTPVNLLLDEKKLIAYLDIALPAEDYNGSYNEDFELDRAYNFTSEPTLPEWKVL